MNIAYAQPPQGPVFQGPPRGPPNSGTPFVPSGVNFTNPFLGQNGSRPANNGQNGAPVNSHLSNVVTTEYEGYRIQKNEAVRVDGMPTTWDDAVIAKLQHAKAKLIEMTSEHKRKGLGDAEKDLAAFKSSALVHSIKRLVAQRNANEQHQQASWTLASVQAVRKERVSKKGRVRELDHVIVILKRERRQSIPGAGNASHAQMPYGPHSPAINMNNSQNQQYSHTVVETHDRISAPGMEIGGGPQMGPPPDRPHAPINPQALSIQQGQSHFVTQQQQYQRSNEHARMPQPTRSAPRPNMSVQPHNHPPPGLPRQLDPMLPQEQPSPERQDFAAPMAPPAAHQNKSRPIIRDDEDYSASDYSSDPNESMSSGGEHNQITPLSSPPQSPADAGSPRNNTYKGFEAYGGRPSNHRSMTQITPHPQRQKHSVSFKDDPRAGSRILQRASVRRDQYEPRELVRRDHYDPRREDFQRDRNARERPPQRQRSDTKGRTLSQRMGRLNVEEATDTYRPSRKYRNLDDRPRRYSSPADEGRPRRGMSVRQPRDWYESDLDDFGDRYARPKRYVSDRR